MFISGLGYLSTSLGLTANQADNIQTTNQIPLKDVKDNNNSELTFIAAFVTIAALGVGILFLRSKTKYKPQNTISQNLQSPVSSSSTEVSSLKTASVKVLQNSVSSSSSHELFAKVVPIPQNVQTAVSSSSSDNTGLKIATVKVIENSLSSSSVQELPAEVVSSESPILKLEEVVPDCIRELDKILDEVGNDSPTAKMFKILKETIGVSEQNHLPWHYKFLGDTDYLDKFHPEDLDGKNVRWGVDQYRRPYIAFTFVFKQTTSHLNENYERIEEVEREEKGCFAIFQRASDNGYLLASGGHYSPLILSHKFDNNSNSDLLNNLTTLLKGEPLSESVGPTTKTTITLSQ